MTSKSPEAQKPVDRPYRQLVEAMPQGVALVSRDGLILYCNARLAEMFGQALADVMGAKLDDLVSGTNVVWAQLLEEVEQGSVHRQFGVRRPDGREVPMALDLNILAAQTYSLLVTDLSQQLQLEELVRSKQALLDRDAALRETNQQLQMSLNVGHAVAFTWDIPSNAAQRLQGIASCFDATTDKLDTFQDLLAKVHPDDRDAFARRVQHCIERPGREYTNDYRVIGPDGSVRWMSDTGRVEFSADKKPLRLVGLATDITDRKAADAELRRRETFTSGILGSITDGLFVMDSGWRLTFANDEIVRRFGVEQTEIIGGHLWEMFPAAKGTVACVNMHRAMAERVTVEYEIFYEPWQRWYLDKAFPTADGGLAIYTQDITERKRVVQALTERTALLNGVLEGTTDVVFVKDLNGRCLMANSACAAALGSTPDQVVGKTTEELCPPDLAVTVRRDDEAVIASGSPVQCEETFLVAGEPRVFLTLKAPLRDGGGRLVGVLGISRDVTDRKQVDEERRLLASIVENSRDFIGISDTHGNPVYGNRAAMGLVGVQDLAQVRRSKIIDYFVPEQRQFVTEVVMPAVLNDGGWSGELTMQHFVTGAKIPVWYDLFRVDDPATGQPVNFATVTRDLTERKREEERLRQSEARLRQVFESNVVGMIRWDLERSLILDANAEFLRMTGYSRDDVTSGRLNFRDLTPPEWAARNEERIRVIQANGHAPPYEKEYFRKDGSRLPLIIAGTRFEDSASEGMSFLIDLSEMKRAEAALRASADRHSYLVKLSDTLRPLSDPIEIQAEASRVLGEQLGANRVAYFEIQGDNYLIERDYTAGVMPLQGGYPIKSFGHEMISNFLDGRMACESDVNANRLRPQAEKDAYAAIKVRSYIAVPLTKNGAFVAGLAVNSASPRAWTPTEIVMIEDTAERTWAAVVQARSAAALRHSEERFSIALKNSRILVYTTDADLRYTWIHDPHPAFDPAGMLGRRDDELLSPEQAVALTAIKLDVLNSGVGRRAEFAAEINDERVVYDLTVEPLRGERGSVVGVTVAAMDITERKREETLLKVSEARYRRLFESAKDGILILDADTATITDANPFIAEMLGYSQDEFVGKELWQIGLFQDVEASKAAMRELQEKRYIRYEDLPLETKAGRRINVEFVSNVYGEDGEAVIQCNIRDITKRRETERALEKALTYVREQANELTEVDRRKDVFLATLAHELRNPLAPIQNGLQIMKLAKGDAGTLEKSRAMMQRQVEHMTRLIDDLMDVSRISQGKIRLQKTRMLLTDAVRNAVDTSYVLIDAQGQDLVVDLPPEPIYVDGDVIRLSQVFANLLNNAAKYTHRGGRIRLTVKRQGSDAVVSVVDNGVGIPADMLTRVFDMFAQLNRSLEKAQSGLGIGLSIVKRLVEMHDGSVIAESGGPGMGSAFTVRLPQALSVTDMRSDDPPIFENATPAACRRILVVDDNQDGASSLVMLLKVMGHDTQTAHDGLEAVAAAEAFRPEVILMDIGMPKLNGYDACRRIRAQPWAEGIVLVAMTGWGQQEDRQKSKDAGFDGHLVKPASHAALMKVLAKS